MAQPYQYQAQPTPAGQAYSYSYEPAQPAAGPGYPPALPPQTAAHPYMVAQQQQQYQPAQYPPASPSMPPPQPSPYVPAQPVPQQPQQYAPAAPAQPVQQAPVFDLDDLLDIGNNGTSTQKSMIPPPPSYPPPAPVNHDPFGFQAPPPTNVGGYSQSPQQPASYPPQSQPVVPMPQQQPQQQPYTFPGPPGAPGPQNPPVSPALPPPAPQPAPAAPGGPIPMASYYYPAQQPPAAPAPLPMAAYQTAAPPAPAVAPPYSYSSGPPQQVAPTASAPAPAYYYGVPPPEPMQMEAPGAPSGAWAAQQQLSQPAPPPSSSLGQSPTSRLVRDDEEADRQRLEQLQRLRRELEREQGREREKVEERETWPCPTCTYRSKLDVNKCTMCDTPRPGFATAAAPAPRPAPVASPLSSVPSPAPTITPGGSSLWLCPRCAVSNSDAANICKVCNTAKPSNPTSPHADIPRAQSVAPTVPAQSASNEAGWNCPVCTLLNPLATPACNACSNPRPPHIIPPPQQPVQARLIQPSVQPPVGGIPGGPTGLWACPQCTFENPRHLPKCGMCETPQPGYVSPPQMVRVPQQMAYPSQQRPIAGRQTVAARPLVPPPSAPVPAAAAAATEEEIKWQDDKFATNCNKCNAAFGVLTRRHHCRSCGFVFCANCSSNFAKLKPTDQKEVRMCIDCFREHMTGPPAPSAVPRPGATSAPAAPQPRPALTGNCDCALAAEGFHRPTCPLGRV